MKWFGQLLLVGMLTLFLFLAGCSTKKSDPDGNKGGEGGKIEITFFHNTTGTELEAMKAFVKGFEDSHPDIGVNMVFAEAGSDADQKLLTTVTGGNPPDVAKFDRFKVASWVAQGALTDLTEMAESDGISADQFYPSSWAEANYKGKLYAMPYSTDSRLLYYNKDHFKEVGLDPENPPKSLEELEIVAEKLTIKKGNRFERIGFIPWYNQGQLLTWSWIFGAEHYDESKGEITSNHPKAVEALQWLVDYGNKYNVEDISGFESAAGSDALDPFISGQLSMKVDGNWTVNNIRKFKPDLNYGVTPIPTPSGTDSTTWVGGQSLIIPKGAKNIEAAWKFLKYMGETEGAKAYFSGLEGHLSAQPSVNEELGFRDDPIIKEFIDILPDAHYRPVITEGQLWYNELKTATENATRGNGTPQENLDKVTEVVNKALKR